MNHPWPEGALFLHTLYGNDIHFKVVRPIYSEAGLPRGYVCVAQSGTSAHDPLSGSEIRVSSLSKMVLIGTPNLYVDPDWI